MRGSVQKVRPRHSNQLHHIVHAKGRTLGGNSDGSRLPPHPFQEGRCKFLAFPREALLVRLEVRNALSDLVAL